MSRAFKTIDQQITTGGDYIESLRRKTMYMSIMRKAQDPESAKSIATHNNNVNIEWCNSGGAVKMAQSNSVARLKSTNSYATLLDMAKGKRQANPVLNGSTASKFNIFTGNFAMVHSKAPIPIIVPFKWDTTQNTNQPVWMGPTNTPAYNTIIFPNNGQSSDAMDASWNQAQYPGWWFDPYGVLTELNCLQTEATNLGTRLVDQVEITYRWSHAYWRSVAGQSMSGFAFPESVTFSLQRTSFADPLTEAYGPLPSFNAYIPGVPPPANPLTPEEEKAREINILQESQLNEWCKNQGRPTGVPLPRVSFNINSTP